MALPGSQPSCADDGVHVGEKRVARIMAARGMAGRCKRRWKKTTIADPDAQTRSRSDQTGLRARHGRVDRV